jgi:hypothetical protein
VWPIAHTKEEQWRYARRWTRASEADEGAMVEWARWQASEMSANSLWPISITKGEQRRYARRWTRTSGADGRTNVEWARRQVREMSAK